MRKAIAGAVAGAMMGAVALTGCGRGSSYSGYDEVYDSNTGKYIYVTDSYYHSHKNQYSSHKVTHVTQSYVTHNHITTVQHPDGSTTVHRSSTTRRVAPSRRSTRRSAPRRR